MRDVSTRFTRRRMAIFASGLAVVLGAAACSSSGNSPSGKTPTSSGGGTKTVKVGLLGPKTGPLAASAGVEEIQRGYELALADFGPKFPKLKFTEDVQDDAGDPATASRVIQTMLHNDKIDVLIGPGTSGSALQIAATMQKAQVPWMSPTSSADPLINLKIQPNYVFRTIQSNSMQAEVAGQYLFANNAKVGVFYSADVFGQSNLASFEQFAKDHNLKIANSEAIQDGATDVTSQVQRMKDAGVTSALIVVAAGGDVATLTKAIVQVGYKPAKLLAGGNVLAPAFYTVATPNQWKNLQIFNPFNPAAPGYVALAQKYQKKFGTPPQRIAIVASAYQSAALYIQAVGKVGDPTKFAEVRKAIEDTPELDAIGQKFVKPFSPQDHDLLSADPKTWALLRLNPEAKIDYIGAVPAA